MTTQVPTEYQECVSFINWCRVYDKNTHDMLFHNANEGLRNPRTGRHLKLMGLKRGYPDYFLAIPNGKYHGLFLEMKRRDGASKKKNEDQDSVIEKLNKQGYSAKYVYGWEHARDEVLNYLNFQQMSRCTTCEQNIQQT